MGLANNLNKFEWENEIPFPYEKVKNSLHAMIGESMNIPGLLRLDADSLHWDLNCVNPENNDAFGSYSFGQVNTKFSVTTKKVDGNSSNLKILVSERQGAFITGNQAYLQSECDKFIKALTFYLEHEDVVDNWYKVLKPKWETEAQNAASSSSSNGCIISIVVGVIIAVALGVWFALKDLA